MERETFRQLIHASGIFIVFLNYFLHPNTVMLICLAIVLSVELIFRIDKKRHIFFFSEILRRSKRDDDERGFIYFFVGAIITLYLFKFNIAIVNAAIIFLVLGDSASTIIGKKFGKHKLPLNKNKTIEGSIAFLIIGFIGALTQLPPIPAFIGALSGALTEAYSPIDDNITIPLISGAVMTLIIFITT